MKNEIKKKVKGGLIWFKGGCRIYVFCRKKKKIMNNFVEIHVWIVLENFKFMMKNWWVILLKFHVEFGWKFWGICKPKFKDFSLWILMEDLGVLNQPCMLFYDEIDVYIWLKILHGFMPKFVENFWVEMYDFSSCNIMDDFVCWTESLCWNSWVFFWEFACVFGLEFDWRVACRIVYFKANCDSLPKLHMNSWNECGNGWRPKCKCTDLWPWCRRWCG